MNTVRTETLIEVMAERDRYRAALEHIGASGEFYHIACEGGTHDKDCPGRIVAEALETPPERPQDARSAELASDLVSPVTVPCCAVCGGVGSLHHVSCALMLR